MKCRMNRGESLIALKSNLPQENIFVQYIILIVLVTLLIANSYYGITYSYKIKNLLNLVGVVGLDVVFIILLVFLVSFEKSMIYENGITSVRSNLYDKLRGTSFVPYSRIRNIFYNINSDGKYEYILVCNSQKPLLPPFTLWIYGATNMKTLAEYLERNTNARWIKRDLKETLRDVIIYLSQEAS